MNFIFNIMQVEMGCVTLVSIQHDSFIKRVKWVESGQPALLTGRVGLKDHDTIIKWVGLGLSHLVEYPYLNTTRTRHANPNWHP